MNGSMLDRNDMKISYLNNKSQKDGTLDDNVRSFANPLNIEANY